MSFWHLSAPSCTAHWNWDALHALLLALAGMEELTVTGLTARIGENVPWFDDIWRRHASTLRVLNLEYRDYDSVPARLNVLRPLMRSHIRLDTLRCADVSHGTLNGFRARDATLLIREVAHAPVAMADRLRHVDVGWLQMDIGSEHGDWNDVWTQFCRAVQHVQLLCLGIRIGGRHAHFAKNDVVIGSNKARPSSELGFHSLRRQMQSASPLRNSGVSGPSCFPGHRRRC